MRKVGLRGLLGCRECTESESAFLRRKEAPHNPNPARLPPPETHKRHNVARMTLLDAASASARRAGLTQQKVSPTRERHVGYGRPRKTARLPQQCRAGARRREGCSAAAMLSMGRPRKTARLPLPHWVWAPGGSAARVSPGWAESKPKRGAGLLAACRARQALVTPLSAARPRQGQDGLK